MNDHNCYDDEPDPIEEEGARWHTLGTPMHASPVGYCDGQRRAWIAGWTRAALAFIGEIEDHNPGMWIKHLGGEHYIVDRGVGHGLFFVAHRGLVDLHDGRGVHKVPESDIPLSEWRVALRYVQATGKLRASSSALGC